MYKLKKGDDYYDENLHEKKYQHVERLGTTSVANIVNHDCYIFHKLDGANGVIWQDSENNNEICCGSRNKELSREKTNHGFWNWVNAPENLNKLKQFFEEHPKCYIYGEWLIQHKIKYNPKSYNRFYIFDIICYESVYKKETYKYVPYNTYHEWCEKLKLDYIPLICVMTRPSHKDLKKILIENRNSFAEPEGFGEGIVIKSYEYRNIFDRVKWAKLISVDVIPKETFEQLQKQEIVYDVEQTIVNKYLPESIIEKEYIREQHKSETPIIARFLNFTWNTFIEEESKHFLLKMKGPLDLDKLRNYVKTKATNYWNETNLKNEKLIVI